MKNYLIVYRKWSEDKSIRIAARSISKAVEIALSYIKKNEYQDHEIRSIQYESSINMVQK